jgi:uncharacterized protein (DUF1501 family)
MSRREWLAASAAGVLAAPASGWFGQVASAAASSRRRSCILLWMSGGPTQTDTFDMKPEHANGGPLLTTVPGLEFSQHLPRLAIQAEHLAVLRSMSTKEGDHQRATFKMRTGYLPQGPIHYPTLGSMLSKELSDGASPLPGFISVAPYRFLSPAAFGPGFLGPEYAPLVVGDGNPLPTAVGGVPGGGSQGLGVRNLQQAVGLDRRRADARLGLLEKLESDFGAERPDVPARSHRSAYRQAVRMMRSESVSAFKLDSEPASLRDAYGRSRFGQGCLLARRLVERGVPFVEVSLNGVDGQQQLGWDTHQNNFDTVKSLSGTLDSGWATLLEDLQLRGLLETTLVIWMGEFGRTPTINSNQGRDHFPGAWTTVLAGGGVRGGQVVGRTSADGGEVSDRPISTGDLMATVCAALGVDAQRQNMSNVGRPIQLVDPESSVVEGVL